jgi:hypothetical protein
MSLRTQLRKNEDKRIEKLQGEMEVELKRRHDRLYFDAVDRQNEKDYFAPFDRLYFDAVDRLNDDQDFNDARLEKFNASTEQEYKDADAKVNRITNAFLQKFTNFYEK